MSEPTQVFSVDLENSRPQQVWVVRRPRQRWWVYFLFFALTMFTTTLVGAHMEANFANRVPVFALDDDLGMFLTGIVQRPSGLVLGLPFSLTLMLILLAHEMGHYLYARHYHVYATPPFFIPFPSLIGTLGAFIRIKGPIPSRDALFDIGIAGPVAGFVPSCAAVVFGVLRSQPLAHESATGNLGLFPLAFHFAARILHANAPIASLSLHPVAAAGWVGLFATSLNLLPSGQLDGGHILYSVLPTWHRSLSVVTVVTLLVLARYFFWVWIIWAAVLWTISYHPPIPAIPTISATRKKFAVIALIMLTLSFTPAPIAHQTVREVWPDMRDEVHDAFHNISNGARHLFRRK